MAAPASPYCTSADVAVFNKGILKGQTDFNNETGTIKKDDVDSMITVIANHVEMQFASAGYKVPFVELSGETWPAFQTGYLNLLVVLGVSAKMFMHLINAYPGAVRSGGRLGNVFDEQYGVELRKIWDWQNGQTQSRLRAQYYIGTPAESILKQQYGMMSDYHLERFDPTRTLSFQDMTDLSYGISLAFKKLEVPWDYMYELAGRGIGPTVYDNYN